MTGDYHDYYPQLYHFLPQNQENHRRLARRNLPIRIGCGSCELPTGATLWNRRPFHQENRKFMYDALIAGGGPAGLSVALLLGRSRRSVLVCDADQPRNGAAAAAHSFLTRDGVPPAELRDRSRANGLLSTGRIGRRFGRRRDRRRRRVHRDSCGRTNRYGADRHLRHGDKGRFACDSWRRGSLGKRCGPLPVSRRLGDPGRTARAAPERRKRGLVVDFSPAVEPELRAADEWSGASERSELLAKSVPVIEASIERIEADGAGVRIVFADGRTMSRRAIFPRPAQAPAPRSPSTWAARSTQTIPRDR
jgi:glycine/D-amino acid oxidase-like deaminating enzyme